MALARPAGSPDGSRATLRTRRAPSGLRIPVRSAVAYGAKHKGKRRVAGPLAKRC